MATGNQGIALRHLDMLFGVGTVAGLTDAQLLERFTSRRDECAELAFAALVERHGPMVLRVCRGVLRDAHEAQDAYQATFLVLARRAGSLQVRGSLGPWLHQVALRTSYCSRTAQARRRRHEGRAAALMTRSTDEGDRDGIGDVIHEEVERLPQRYRAAVVLCLLEGLTPDQASRHLGWPVGTVHSRLARGREQLRGRLTRRGLAAPSGLPVVGWAWGGASAAVPASLVDATIRAALPFTAGTVPASVEALAGILLRSMLMARIRGTVAALLTLGVLAVGAGVFARQEPGEREPREVPRGDSVRSPVGASPSPYATVKSLEAAVHVAKRPLEGRHVSDLNHPYDALLVLLSEKRVKEAIPIASKNYESILERHPETRRATQDYFRSAVMPKLRKIAEEGAWPEGCSFDYFVLSGGPRPEDPPSGLSLQIRVETPGDKYPLFALPIIVVKFGDFGSGKD